MKCRYLFLCLVLASCSPLYYSGEQVARTFNQETSIDSASLHRLLDRVVHDELEKQLDVHHWADESSVKETFSAPDSTGKQYLLERTTTSSSAHTETSAHSSHRQDEQYQEKVDSSSFKSSEDIEMKEEEKTITAKADGWMPWYIYAAALLGALVLGFALGVKKKKWFHLKTR